MSFLGVLKSIGHGFQVGLADITPFAPVVASIPTIGPMAVTILGAITAVEQLIPSTVAAPTGPVKKTVVTSIVNASAPGIDPAVLSKAIDAIVSALNALQAAFAPVAAKP